MTGRSLLQYLTCKGGTFEPYLGSKKCSKLQPMKVQDGADKDQVLSGPLTLLSHSLLERGLYYHCYWLLSFSLAVGEA